MAKKGNRLVYGEGEPTSINNLNSAYMTAYLKAKLEDGTITKKQVADYKKKKNAEIAKEKDLTPIKKSQIERKQFAAMFMPSLVAKKSIKIDFDAELDALIND